MATRKLEIEFDDLNDEAQENVTELFNGDVPIGPLAIIEVECEDEDE